MRYVYTSLTVLLLLAPPALGQWSTQSPAPTHLDVRGVAAPTPQRVFIATADDSFDDGGALFESADGGATWVQRDVPASLASPLNGLFFLDAQRGWAFGNENARTTDGGTTWQAIPSLGSTYFMRFYTPDFGLATGNFGRQVSRDGGLTWEPSPEEIFAFDFADDLLGLGISEAGIYRTTDGGQTFALVQPGQAAVVAWLSGTVAVGIVDGAFVRSEDGGQTWAVGASAEGRTRLSAVSETVVLAWTGGTSFNTDGRVLRSDDGGQTWTDLGTVIVGGTRALTTVDPQTVAAMSTGGDLFHSADAGQTWALAFASPGPRPSSLSAIAPAFADAQTGYVAYGRGFVLKTTDGGASWSQVSSGHGESLTDVDRFEDGRLIAVGEDRTVLTSDGDGRWVLRQFPATSEFSVALKAVHVVGPQSAVAVDEEGRVYSSTDGGATWTAGGAVPAFAFDAADLHFSTLLDGWVAGAGNTQGALFRTTDGGDSWTAAPGIAGSLVALDFEGEAGWATYSGALFYRTTDGGANWTQHELPDELGFLTIADMDFWDASVGYAVGRAGYAARSDDGGQTWTVPPTPTDEHHFTDLFLIGPDELWVSTREGVAYYSATGGQNWAVMDLDAGQLASFEAITATSQGDAWMVGYGGAIEHFAGPPPPPVNRPPEASFTFDTNRLTVTFTDTSTDPDGTVVGYSWDFGDGTTSTEQNPVHTFPGANTYIVILTVTDDDGTTGSFMDFIIVQPGPGGTFGNFTEVTPYEPPFVTPQDESFWVTTTAAADYDGDGDLDIAVLGFGLLFGESGERLLLFRNDGEAGPEEWAFTYIDVPLGDLVSGASDLAWGDYDGDGDQDLVVGTDGATVIYRNDDGVLTPTNIALPGYYEDNDQADFDLRSITWADFDNDGDLDLLIPSVIQFDPFGYRTALMRNDGPSGDGGWAFTEIDAGLAPTTHAQSAWADYDGDGDLDLLLVNAAPLTDESFVRIYRNDGGTFAGEDVLGPLTIEHGEAQWGDYDADGDHDILVVGHVATGDGGFDRILRIYRNDAGTYTPFDVIPSIGAEGWFDLTAATWADYDSDGDVDILLTGTYNSGSQIEGRARIYANDGGVFTDMGTDLPAPRASGTRGGTFSWLDMDGDGDLDYFIAGDYWVPGGNNRIESQIHLYRNDAEGQNERPSAPLGLAATVDEPDPLEGGATVILTWDAATDDSTPAHALTYDLDLRRDGESVATPRRLPEPGNVSAVTSWVLTGLPDGAYTWTVRAVDSAFNGSEPASGTFAIGATANEGGSTPPAAYALEAAYPNPFREATTLRFALPEQAKVDLAVYDLLGRRVAQLVRDLRPAGYYEVRLDAAGLASGTYVVRLSAGSFTGMRRALLLR